MPLADARAQVGDLAVVPHDPVADAAWLDRLAQGCARYTPLVALDAPDGLILDIAGAAHLFGGEAGLVADVEGRMDRLGMTLRSALAGSARVIEAGLDDALAARSDVIVLMDRSGLQADGPLAAWVAEGGLLIRFAGPRHTRGLNPRSH